MNDDSYKLVVIQGSTFCNLDCSYCYLPDREKQLNIEQETLDRILDIVSNDSMLPGPTDILWHAGEPLTLGLDFYENALNLLNKKNTKKREFAFGFQTNGVLINDKWIEFFKKNKCKIGISIDGPEFIHNNYRTFRNGRGSHHLAERGLNRLKSHKIPFGIVSVLTNYSLDFPDEIFDYFNNLGIHSVGFNLEESEGENANSTISLEQTESKYMSFFSRLFDRWIIAGKPFKIREFSKFETRVKKLKQNSNFIPIDDDRNPFKIITFDIKGNVYTFSPELTSGYEHNPLAFSIGNVFKQKSLKEIEQGQAFQNLKNSVLKGINMCRESCTYFNVCGGGAPSSKIYENKSFESTETTYCKLSVQALSTLLTHKYAALS